MRVILFMLLILPGIISAQIKGKITDRNGNPISGATVSIQNTYLSSPSNALGDYEIKVPPGDYVMQVYAIGHELGLQSVIVSEGQTEVNFQLDPVQKVIETVSIRNTGNRADAIIREAIQHRRENGQQYDSYRANFYSKGSMRVIDLPNKIFGIELDENKELMDELLLDSSRSGIMYLSETMSEVAYDRPNKFTETIKASKVSGNDRGYSFNTAQGANFDFYTNQVDLIDYLISPIADQAFQYYRYQLIQSFESGDHLIHEIKVIPRRIAEPVVSGSIYLIDQTWQIYAVDFSVKGSSLKQPILDSVQIRQQYVYHPMDDNWSKQSQNIQLYAGLGKLKFSGHFDHVFSNYQFVSSFPKATFGKTLIKVEEQSNTLSDDYWDTHRPFVLKDEELINYARKDSIQRIRKTPAYLDSMDRENNKFSVGNVLYYRYQHTRKKQELEYNFLDLGKTQYNAVQGFVLNLAVKAQQERQEGFGGTYLTTDLGYGFADQQFRFEGSVRHVLNSKAWKAVEISGGSTVKQFDSQEPISPFINTISTLFFDENYIRLYQRDYIKAGYEQVFSPLISASSSLSYNRRSPLFINSHYSFSDEDNLMASNNPLDPNNYETAPFETHRIALWDIGVTFRPGRSVIDRPDGYSYIDHPNNPTINLSYQQGFASAHNFQLISSKIKQGISLKNKGNLFLSAEGGYFLNANNLSFIDYKHFNGNETGVGTASDYTHSFMLLPYYTQSTNRQYIETHAAYHLNGFLLNKIPLINKLGFTEVIGHHHFTTPGRPSYQEFTFGLDNIGWGKYRLFRLDYVRSKQGGEYRNGWLIGFKFLDF